jgi:hypothetical protein
MLDALAAAITVGNGQLHATIIDHLAIEGLGTALTAMFWWTGTWLWVISAPARPKRFPVRASARRSAG